jgi:hypothetical protein
VPRFCFCASTHRNSFRCSEPVVPSPASESRPHRSRRALRPRPPGTWAPPGRCRLQRPPGCHLGAGYTAGVTIDPRCHDCQARGRRHDGGIAPDISDVFRRV